LFVCYIDVWRRYYATVKQHVHYGVVTFAVRRRGISLAVPCYREWNWWFRIDRD